MKFQQNGQEKTKTAKNKQTKNKKLKNKQNNKQLY